MKTYQEREEFFGLLDNDDPQAKYTVRNNDQINNVIRRFSISSNSRKATTTFCSNKKISQEIQAVLLVDSDFHMNISSYSIYGDDEVMTVIFWRGECSVDKFLTIGSVRRVFLNAL